MGIDIIREGEMNITDSVIGKGKLRGTRDADQFTFDQFEKFRKKKADKIIGFNSSQGDTIGVSPEAFPSLKDADENRGLRFASASTKKKLKRLSKQDYDFVYFEKQGQLFFDGNGTAPGWGTSTEGGIFAILKGKPELSAEDFTLLA